MRTDKVFKGALLCGWMLAFSAMAQVQPAQAPSATDPGATLRPDLPVPANAGLPSLILVGDSTVRNGKGDGASHWLRSSIRGRSTW